MAQSQTNLFFESIFVKRNIKNGDHQPAQNVLVSAPDGILRHSADKQPTDPRMEQGQMLQ